MKKKPDKHPKKSGKSSNKLKPPVRFRTALESHLKGRADIWPSLLKNRDAIARIALKREILPTDAKVLHLCAAFTFAEMLWEETRAMSPDLDKPGKN